MTSKGIVSGALAAAIIVIAPFCQANSSTERSELELMLRQLDMLSRMAEKGAGQHQAESARFHFDYERLQEDLKRVRSGISGYLSPTRAQPRDPSKLSGHYTRTGSANP